MRFPGAGLASASSVPAGVLGLPSSNVPLLAPSGCSGSFFFFFFFWGRWGGKHLRLTKSGKREVSVEGLRDGTEVGGLRSVNVPSLPTLAPPAPEVPSQTMGIHRPRARPREGRTSPSEGPGGGDEGEELGGGVPPHQADSEAPTHVSPGNTLWDLHFNEIWFWGLAPRGGAGGAGGKFRGSFSQLLPPKCCHWALTESGGIRGQAGRGTVSCVMS